MKYFSLPSDYKLKSIDAYYDINSFYQDCMIYETYGLLTISSPYNSSTLNINQLPQVDIKKLEKYIKYSIDSDIQFNYVLDNTCMNNLELTKEGAKKISQFIKRIHGIGVNWLTISLPSIIEIAKASVPEIKIKASAACNIDSPTKAEFYRNLGVNRIVLDTDIYRRFDVMENIVKVFDGDIEVILNSSCISGCPFKNFHHNYNSHFSENKDIYQYYYSRRCRNLHTSGDDFMKMNWIRPEDLYRYYDLGVTYFSLVNKGGILNSDPLKAVVHYIEGKFNGNLISLLELFSTKKPLSVAETYIDNKQLKGFLDKFIKYPKSCSKVCSQCGYCSSYAEAAISSTDMAFMEVVKAMEKPFLKEFTKKLEIT